jgi:hypothetical protein
LVVHGHTGCVHVLTVVNSTVLLWTWVSKPETGPGGNSMSNFFFFFWYWALNSGPSPWAIPPAFFSDGFFQDRVLWNICLGWLWTVILLISGSWVARITGVSYQCWAMFNLLRTCKSQAVCTAGHHFTFLPAVTRFQFLHILSGTCHFLVWGIFFNNGHFNRQAGDVGVDISLWVWFEKHSCFSSKSWWQLRYSPGPSANSLSVESLQMPPNLFPWMGQLEWSC